MGLSLFRQSREKREDLQVLAQKVVERLRVDAPVRLVVDKQFPAPFCTEAVHWNQSSPLCLAISGRIIAQMLPGWPAAPDSATTSKP
jgi:hypothetical protein